MSSRKEEIRKRIEKRKKEQSKLKKNIDNRILWEDEDDDFNAREKREIYYEEDGNQFHPLFRKELFLLKILGAAVFFLAVAIIVKQQTATFASAEKVIRQSMNQEFNFAGVSNWYEKQFGKPLAFLPLEKQKEEKEENNLQQYALSASGKILEDFNDNGQRVAIETDNDTTVQAMNEGFVKFAGEKEGFGNTVIIQHSDKSESWYGNLKEIDVKIYENLKKGDKVGLASSYENDESLGLFYFAIKKDNDFIDPIQVIDFE
ncbi:M23 family metallopeptidase [Niallia sp. NCCP-28]|uniref:M23 family metallopeptidase n=1 Tax=Niallia sp. NCCP-28 TaxID=2934712 RepID=UPI00208C28CD|nr:M23 family metallopeptidase [Niallia sp. NCCP-28]GKU81431.1 stage IV sporulation protein FA [Niallia sp. NCCP-28]